MGHPDGNVSAFPVCFLQDESRINISIRSTNVFFIDTTVPLNDNKICHKAQIQLYEFANTAELLPYRLNPYPVRHYTENVLYTALEIIHLSTISIPTFLYCVNTFNNFVINF